MTVLDALKARSATTGALRQRVQVRLAAHPFRWAALALVLLTGMVLWGRTVSSGATFAAEPQNGSPYTSPSASAAPGAAPLALDAGQGFLSVIWPVTALLVVLAALYASLWVLRRYTTQRTLRSGGLLEVSASVRLGANQTLHVVRFGSSRLLVGASQAGLSVLATEPDVQDQDGDAPAFASVLAGAEDAARGR